LISALWSQFDDDEPIRRERNLQERAPAPCTPPPKTSVTA